MYLFHDTSLFLHNLLNSAAYFLVWDHPRKRRKKGGNLQVKVGFIKYSWYNENFHRFYTAHKASGMAGNKQQPTELLVSRSPGASDILTLLEKDLTNSEIASELTLALSSVKWYIQQIFGKLGVNRRRWAVARARQLGLLESAGYREGFSTSDSQPDPRHNLPRQLTSLVGREREIAQVKSLLEKHALVTLTGSGRVGKSRLALRLGWSPGRVQRWGLVCRSGVSEQSRIGLYRRQQQL
jgi:DNA-binding CsgD family transcriptional regulator